MIENDNGYTATYLIGKYLPLSHGTEMEKPCALCGIHKCLGLPIKEVIGPSFMDDQYLGDSGVICIYCAACLGKGQSQSDAIRVHNFLANKVELRKPTREELWDLILNPPEPPFVFGITKSHKKHISFKAPVNMSKADYIIQTENYHVKIVLDDQLKILMNTIQKWYTICKDTKQEPTFFTKSEILYDTDRFTYIERYGTETFIQENNLIERYRKTALLDLLVFTLNKKGIKK